MPFLSRVTLFKFLFVTSGVIKEVEGKRGGAEEDEIEVDS
jgi:hypothetical protein